MNKCTWVKFVGMCVLVAGQLTLCGCFAYHVDHNIDRLATLRKSDGGKYQYEIELTDHATYFGNVRERTHETTFQDEKVWIYVDKDIGLIDMSLHTALAFVRNATSDPAPLTGSMFIQSDNLEIRNLATSFKGSPLALLFNPGPHIYNGKYVLKREHEVKQ